MKYLHRLFITLFLLYILAAQAGAEETLSWGDCLARAAENNPELFSASEGVNVQKAQKTITASGLYPQISGSIAATTSKAGSSTSGSDSYSYGISGTQLVFDGLKTANEVNAAAENIQAAQQNYRFVSSTVRLNLRTAFINLLTAQELIRVTEEIAKIRRDNLELITLSYYSGLEHRGALLTAEANLAEADFELAQAKRNVELWQRQLIKEMGLKEFKPLSVSGDFTVKESIEDKPDFAELVKNNPSLLQAAANKNAAVFGIKSAYAEFFPEVSGSASTSKASPTWPMDKEKEAWSLGLSLSMPIFEGGLRSAKVAKAKSEYLQSEADERSTRDTVIINLEEAWKSLQDKIGSVEVQRKSLAAAEERSKIAEAQYSTGFIAFDNWIIIENDLVLAKKAYLQSQANALLAEAAWIQAKGETLEYAQ